MNYRFNIFILLIVVMLSSCKKDQFCNCLEKTGDKLSETRSIPSFHTIIMDNNIDVILTPGIPGNLTITCGENLMDGIKTEVKDGRLEIKNLNKCNWLRDFKNKFTVEVTVENLMQVTTYGSGNLSCTDTLFLDELQVESWNGTGTLNFLLSCNEARLKIHTGPADIIASGNTASCYIYSAGNGFCNAGNLLSSYATITTHSTGDCEVNVINELEAKIDYQGDVYFKGNPHTIRKTGTGSGQLIKR